MQIIAVRIAVGKQTRVTRNPPFPANDHDFCSRKGNLSAEPPPRGLELRLIPGFPSAFAAGGNGEIYKENRRLKGHAGRKLYRRVTIRLNGKDGHHYVHKLIALAFIGPRLDGLQIDHIDGNKLNNTPANLRYVTCHENIAAYWIRKRACGEYKKDHCVNGHELTPENTGSVSTRPGTRVCRTCARLSVARSKARKNAFPPAIQGARDEK